MTRAPKSVERGDKTRSLILEAILDLPLGASLRDVAAKVGRHVNTVAHHVVKMKRTGHVEVVRRGYQKRKVVVPVRMRLNDQEREWLKLGHITARAIVVVARAEGRRVSSAEVAKALGWNQAVARYHLQRARAAGFVEARHGSGYTLPCAHPVDRERAGLDERAKVAVRYIVEQGRRVSSWEVARVHDWTIRCAKYHLNKAVKAGLLTVHNAGAAGGYEATPGARHVNWTKSAASA